MIDLLRQHPPAVTWLDSLGEEEIILSGFVVMELLQGCSNKTEQAKVEQVLTGFEIVWPLAIKLAELFNVTTDQLLRDELEVD
jgi:predicted nucleic acid-binding protein